MENQRPDPDDLTASARSGKAPNAAAGTSDRIVGRRTRAAQSGPAPCGKRGRRRRTREFHDDTAPSIEEPAKPDGTPTISATEVGGATDFDDHDAGEQAHRFKRWHAAMLGLATIVFVGAVAFAGATVHTYMTNKAAAAARLEVARTAVSAVTTLWTYTPDTVDSLADRSSLYLSGDFYAQYRKFMDAAAAPNKQAQVSDTTEVVGAGVESLNGADAVAIVFTNTTATSPLTKNVPSLKYVGYRLAMKREGGRWLVTKMSTVSFTDLTPQL